ncbi:MAG: hydrogenase formation protein HypD [Eubacteriales bacterium]|nr:hydrogenase formation protein HypD [Eubacteriales bacterium]
MTTVEGMLKLLRAYDGPPLDIMEVCGTHTAVAARSGLRSLLPQRIRLISGPGCPVCLAAPAYIDKLCALAQEGCIVASFGDLLKVRGSGGSLLDARAQGCAVEMVASPMDALAIARHNPQRTVVMAAVGFETTAPTYALALRSAQEEGIGNFRLLTALKRLLPALEALCADGSVDGFIAPGHVAAIIGSDCFTPLARRFGRPFVVAGFTPENMLAALCTIVQKAHTAFAGNLYAEVVRPAGNAKALAVIEAYFEPGEAYWRGLTQIPASGFYLKDRYKQYDAGSRGLHGGQERGDCRCGDVLTGRLSPVQCPLFGGVCTPQNAVGPCMVSAEGACGIWYREGAAYDD